MKQLLLWVWASTGDANFSFALIGLSAATSGWLRFHVQSYLENFSLKQNLFCCLLLWLSWLMAFFWFCTILSWSTQSLTWFSEYLSQKSYIEHESRMNSHLNWLYTCNPLGCLREIYQTSHLSLQLQVYLLKEWAPSIVFLFLYNMPSLDSFFLTVFLFHFIEVEAKHKIPQCLIRMCDHRLLWTLEIKLSITVLKVSPGG